MTTIVAPPVSYSVDADAIGWIVFDAPHARANVFNTATLDALQVALDAAEASRARALVVTGAKERIFIAGADLRALQALPDVAAAAEFSRRGQHLFERLARFPAPVVVSIHGACAGGGYELALACHWRIATDDPATRIGLPEVSVGTIPGWGGCVRLPRLVGLEPAIRHVLAAKLLPAPDALASGLVDEVVPESELRAQAKDVALRLAREGVPPREAPPMPERVRLRERPPTSVAGAAAVEAMEHGATLPIDEAFHVETALFAAITAGETCKNHIHAFFLREAAKKRTLEGWFAPTSVRPPAKTIMRVGVIGAGVMGSGITHWLASHGYTVVLRDMNPGLVEHGMTVVRSLFADAEARGRSTPEQTVAALQAIETAGAWEGLADCDLVIEAIVENVAAKRALFAEIAAQVRPDAVLASNTSAIPIEEIAGHVRYTERTLGIHFFNPVSRMPLVELVLGRQTSAEAAALALQLIRSLGKAPVICRSSPGFLVTRVLFFYLNAAVRLWERGTSGQAIDAAMRAYGWPMGPLRLIDEVGTDVTAFIFDEMAHYFPDRFVASQACHRLIAAGLNGRKHGESRGFYRYVGKDGESNESEARLLTASAREPSPVDEGQITNDLMRVMVDEARRCLAEGVVKSPDDVDFALLAGAGFPAFRGGLLHSEGTM